MIIGNRTKLHYKKKAWLTPKHPLYFEDKKFKLYYAAAVVMQAQVRHEMTPEQNFELERFLYRGMEICSDDMRVVTELVENPSEVFDYLYANITGKKQKYLLLLDCYNVSCKGELSREEREHISLTAHILEVPERYLRYFEMFVRAAGDEKEEECRKFYGQMREMGIELSLMELKYYLMSLSEEFECRQEHLEKMKRLRLVDKCVLKEDIVLRDGMELHMDCAVVRIYGNITLDGGKLFVENSRIIRKGNSHRACINIRREGELLIRKSDIDCRNQGMLVRAQDGKVSIFDSEIYNTTRGAAVRFWGDSLRIERCLFHHCYSNDDGGAVLVRDGRANISKCRFWHCEAVNGGAICSKGRTELKNCFFKKCYASEYGAAVFYHGFIGTNICDLQVQECFPEQMEIVQYLSENRSLDITGDMEICDNTVLDCEIDIASSGSLWIHDASVFLRYPIKCRGWLNLERVYISVDEMQYHDMILVEHARGCRIRESRLDGMGQNGGIFATGTHLELYQSVFCNMKGGRAIFNALSPVIRECVFNYCQNGGVHCLDGTLEKCLFVNCRGKSGAGISMLGRRGEIKECRFLRCISDMDDGPVDRAVGCRVVDCEIRNEI